MKFQFHRTIFLLAVTGSLFVPCFSQGAGVAWNKSLVFSEFEGSPGGFEDDRTPVLLADRNTPAPATRSYDVLKPSGSAVGSGPVPYTVGQDGQTDLTMTTRIFEGNGDRWGRVNALKRRNGYMGDINVVSGTSMSGDFGVVAFEISLSAELMVDAANFGVRVASANGLGEIYEWTFVTLGGINDAPFDPNRFQDYNATIYNDLSNSSYLNPDGSVKSGGTATNERLASGKTMSQFLAGAPSGAPDPKIGPGWYAMDRPNVEVLDGEETAFTNPGSGASDILDHTITGADLGLQPTDKVTKFTVWFGYYDVAFDTSGDGFTMANSNQDAWITRITLGNGVNAAVPEPNEALILSLAGLLCCLRRRRPRSRGDESLRAYLALPASSSCLSTA